MALLLVEIGAVGLRNPGSGYSLCATLLGLAYPERVDSAYFYYRPNER